MNAMTAHFRTYDETALAAAWRSDAKRYQVEMQLRTPQDPLSDGKIRQNRFKGKVMDVLRAADGPMSTHDIRNAVRDTSDEGKSTDGALRRLIIEGAVMRCPPIYSFGRRRAMWAINQSA